MTTHVAATGVHPVHPASPTPFSPSWQRSVSLFSAFRVEQTDPDRFYGTLAHDSVRQIAAYTSVASKHVLDVGGGPGYWADEFTAAGARYTPLDADAGELALHGRVPLPGTVLGDGQRLPFRGDAFDIVYSSNVAEHVPQPWVMGDEMIRVCRPGGLIFYSYTVWYGPWGGHETAPWHFVSGRFAAARYARRHGHRPKNDYGIGLFPVTVSQGLTWARNNPRVEILDAIPRYLPRSLYGVVRVPVLREFVTWNLALVMRKR